MKIQHIFVVLVLFVLACGGAKPLTENEQKILEMGKKNILVFVHLAME